VGWTLAAAQCLFSSQIFLSKDLVDYERTWAAGSKRVQKWVRKTRRMSTDWVTGYTAAVLGVPQYDFPEVRCTWRQYVPNDGLNYAVTHPCKEMKL
jgi:hypothetical protein